ncbi:MAG: cobalamin biosynthesis protein, partial [Clostridia bacterium]|nr:cobalamin biosynthesis protein [Clostridia bacterium]
VPRVLHLGLGCRRGTEEETIRAAVEGALAAAGVDPAAIRCAASIDLKKDEAGLLAFCEHKGWPVSFYTAEELKALPGEFTPSAFVAQVTGVDNVCERAAMRAAGEGARLIVKKTSLDGVTVAAARQKWSVSFE